jgi:hypothetical protein
MIAELTHEMRTSTATGWAALRTALEGVALVPDAAAVVSVVRDSSGQPAAGLLVTVEGDAHGFVRDQGTDQFQIGSPPKMPKSVQASMAISIDSAVEFLTGGEP